MIDLIGPPGVGKTHLAIALERDPQDATNARDWEYQRAINKDIPYKLNDQIYDTNYTYCSKSSWQAWFFGAGRTIAPPISGWVLPQTLYDSVELRRLYDTGLW